MIRKLKSLLILTFTMALLLSFMPTSFAANYTYIYKGNITALNTSYFTSNSTNYEIAYHTFTSSVSGKYKFTYSKLSGFFDPEILAGSLGTSSSYSSGALCDSVALSDNPYYPTGCEAELNAGQTYYVMFTGFAGSGPASANITVTQTYKNINVYSKSVFDSTSTLITNTKARLYSNGAIFINLNNLDYSTTGLISGTDYITDYDGTVWFSKNYLSSDPSTMAISTDNSTQVTITVSDSSLIAFSDNVNGGGGGVAIASLTQTISACSPNCAYTFYLMSGINTYSNFWDTAESQIKATYGSNVQVYKLFPYNYMDGKGFFKRTGLLFLQARNVARDASVLNDNDHLSQRITDEKNFVLNNYNGGKRIIIGHSGGGVAGSRVTGYLEEKSSTKINYNVMVGAPMVNLKDTFTGMSGHYGDIYNKTTYIKSPNDTIVPKSGLDSWYSYPPVNNLLINVAPGGATYSHANYFNSISWSDPSGSHNNVQDTINLIHNYAY